MSETANTEGHQESEKPVTTSDEVKFPPFPEPTDKDFDDIPEEERNYYKEKFPDINAVKTVRLHCTACDRHLGSSARNVSRMRAHPMLRTLVCHTCHTFYNSGEFEKGDDGSELYCRWCGQGGQVYCCSNCPHVFCAKCIKRNFGAQKIKYIESTDDWKCFKCNPESLLYLRAICWAVLRYCDLKNEIAYKTEDPALREKYQKDCAHDYADCCKSRNRRREKVDASKKKESENKKNATAASIISKIPSTIQVKKFATINTDDNAKTERKAPKRPASPRNTGILIKNPISIAPGPRLINPISLSPAIKKLRVTNTPIINTYTRIKQRAVVPIISNYNGFNNTRINNFNSVNMVVNDNINLSLENLTQGLDMATMTAMSNDNNTQNDDVVCTPDFPMEPLCEVNEDNDDDVQCITPDPVIVNYKSTNPPPLVPRGSSLPDLSSENIIQMTENDVTVNLITGGLKFRVDPQTLSSNKMYRLPDGRVFAIKSNPNMPGGYSATIVAVTENSKTQNPTRGVTFSAKLNAVPNSNTSTPIAAPKSRNHIPIMNSKRNNVSLRSKSVAAAESVDRECDLSVPVEWYRYNLIDAVDALEYSLSRLKKLKKEATTMFLRTRTINEMRNLHKTLDRLLSTSSKRFNEIRDNLGKELKQYILKKKGGHVSDEDDDDVEILPDLRNDDPIFIDENSVDSNANDSISQEVDLTGPANSEHDGGEKLVNLSAIETTDSLSVDNNTTIINSSDELQAALSFVENVKTHEKNNKLEHNLNKKDEAIKSTDPNDFKDTEPLETTDTNNDKLVCKEVIEEEECENQITDNTLESSNEQDVTVDKEKELKIKEELEKDVIKEELIKDGIEDLEKDVIKKELEQDNEESEKNNKDNNHKKIDDTEMSHELIENLLKEDADDAVTASYCMDIPDLPAT